MYTQQNNTEDGMCQLGTKTIQGKITDVNSDFIYLFEKKSKKTIQNVNES